MSAPNTLRQQWEQALVFRIGEDVLTALEQIPRPAHFPSPLLNALSESEAIDLGYVLCLGLLKLYRPCTSYSDDDIFDCVSGGVFEGYIFEALDGKAITSGNRGLIRSSVFWNLGRYLTLAARSPEHLAQFHRLLDSLDNEALHQMAMQAVSGQEVADLFHIGNY